MAYEYARVEHVSRGLEKETVHSHVKDIVLHKEAGALEIQTLGKVVVYAAGVWSRVEGVR